MLKYIVERNQADDIAHKAKTHNLLSLRTHRNTHTQPQSTGVNTEKHRNKHRTHTLWSWDAESECQTRRSECACSVLLCRPKTQEVFISVMMQIKSWGITRSCSVKTITVSSPGASWSSPFSWQRFIRHTPAQRLLLWLHWHLHPKWWRRRFWRLPGNVTAMKGFQEVTALREKQSLNSHFFISTAHVSG